MAGLLVFGISQAALLFVFAVAVGAYGTLVGVGGGFLIVPTLLFLGVSPQQAAGTSLAIVFFNALVGTVSYAPSRRVDYRTGALFAAATVPGAVAGAYASTFLAGDVFDTLFGVLLLLVAVSMQLRRPPPTTHHLAYRAPSSSRLRVRRVFADRFEVVHEYEYGLVGGVAIGVLTGFLSSLFGVGGGIFLVPAFIFLFGLPVHIATATSVLVLVCTSAVGALSHALLGHIRPDIAIPMAAGVIVGARIGAAVAPRLLGEWLVRLLSLALAVIGIRLILG